MKSVKAQIIDSLDWFLAKLKGTFTQKSEIVNNCVSTSTNAPLAAAQGKALSDSISALNSDLSQQISALNSNLWHKIYPVGSIYLSTNNTNPSTFWGGTWVAWGSGRVPVGVNTGDSNFNAVEKTGGTKSVNLTHSHTVNSHAHTISHTHTVNSHTHSTGGHVITVNELPSRIPVHANGQNVNLYDGGSASGLGIAYTSANRGEYQLTIDGGGAVHNHGNTGSASPATGGASTSNSGSASPGTNSQLGNMSTLQPYITCYMWKRTA